VLIPAFNASRFIEECIASVLIQSHRPDRIIVYDDGSSDDTATLAEHYGSCEVIRGRENLGVGASRQELLMHSSAEWVLFLDADDVLLPFASEVALAELREAHALDLVSFLETSFAVPPSAIENPRERPLTFDQVWWRNTIVSSAAFIRRESALRAGGYSNERRLIDYDMWLRLLSLDSAAGKIVETPVVARYISAETITGDVVPAVREQLRLIRIYAPRLTLGPPNSRLWRRRLFELWWRGFKRHVKYGRDPRQFIPMTELHAGPKSHALDLTLRSHLAMILFRLTPVRRLLRLDR